MHTFLDELIFDVANCTRLNRSNDLIKGTIRLGIMNGRRPDELDLIQLYERANWLFNGGARILQAVQLIRTVKYGVSHHECRINELVTNLKTNSGRDENAHWAMVKFVDQVNSDGWRIVQGEMVRNATNGRYVLTLDFFVEVRYLIKENGRRIYDV